MPDTTPLFLVTGGGTGAKVAEALVHLCAAGLGPAEVHILFVDADSQNGNLKRADATAAAYTAMQQWPWSVETKTGGRFASLMGNQTPHKLTLFRSQIALHALTRPLDTAAAGGIASLVHGGGPDGELGGSEAVLDLLYDADEQQARADDGFRARPNLGCLLLADHFEQHFDDEAHGFVVALDRALSAGQPVPVVVAASIFGGTGASLLPVARGAVEAALMRVSGGTQPHPRAGMIRWGAAMSLPHYQPTKRLESVDPDRYLLDTSNALQFYGLAASTSADLYDATYVVGSDRPSRNQVRPSLGDRDQANPAYVEEAVSALAALHFAETLGAGGRSVRVFAPDPNRDRIEWAHLPLGGQQRLAERMAYLLHLGALFLRPADPVHPTLGKGLAGLIQGGESDADLETYAWFQNVLHPWAEQVSNTYRGTPKGRRAEAMRSRNVLGNQAMDALRSAAVEYFGRLNLWAASALLDGEDGALHLLTHLPDSDYAILQGEMAKLNAADVDAPAPGEQVFQPEQDNALARLLRTALAAEVNAHERTRDKGIVIGRDFELLKPQDGRIELRITTQQVRDALRNEGLGAIAAEYTGTAA